MVLRDIDKSTIGNTTAHTHAALLDQVVPAINRIHDALRDLERRVTALEERESAAQSARETLHEVQSMEQQIGALRASLGASKPETDDRLEDHLPTPVVRRLKASGLHSAADVRAASDRELKKIKGIGAGRLEQIRSFYPAA
jgi:ERCC4-type nuclease